MGVPALVADAGGGAGFCAGDHLCRHGGTRRQVGHTGRGRNGHSGGGHSVDGPLGGWWLQRGGDGDGCGGVGTETARVGSPYVATPIAATFCREDSPGGCAVGPLGWRTTTPGFQRLRCVHLLVPPTLPPESRLQATAMVPAMGEGDQPLWCCLLHPLPSAHTPQLPCASALARPRPIDRTASLLKCRASPGGGGGRPSATLSAVRSRFFWGGVTTPGQETLVPWSYLLFPGRHRCRPPTGRSGACPRHCCHRHSSGCRRVGRRCW